MSPVRSARLIDIAAAVIGMAVLAACGSSAFSSGTPSALNQGASTATNRAAAIHVVATPVDHAISRHWGFIDPAW